MCLEPVLRNKRSHRNEKPVHHNKEEPPLAATRESLRTATKTQCSEKLKLIKKKKKRKTPLTPIPPQPLPQFSVSFDSETLEISILILLTSFFHPLLNPVPENFCFRLSVETALVKVNDDVLVPNSSSTEVPGPILLSPLAASDTARHLSFGTTLSTGFWPLLSLGSPLSSPAVSSQYFLLNFLCFTGKTGES